MLLLCLNRSAMCTCRWSILGEISKRIYRKKYYFMESMDASIHLLAVLFHSVYIRRYSIPLKKWAWWSSTCIAITQRSLLIAYQLSFIHNISPTQSSLFRAGIKDSDICPLCNSESQSLGHMLFTFYTSSSFWKQFKHWWRKRFQEQINLLESVILYGWHKKIKHLACAQLHAHYCKIPHFHHKCRQWQPGLWRFSLTPEKQAYYSANNSIYK